MRFSVIFVFSFIFIIFLSGCVLEEAVLKKQALPSNLPEPQHPKEGQNSQGCKSYSATLAQSYGYAKNVVTENNVLVILWDPNRPEAKAPEKEEVENVVFGNGTSARNYFLGNSQGRLSMKKAAVLGWYKADKPTGHYWAAADANDADNDGWVSGHVEKWAEAVGKADKEFDFASYDRNRDGVLGQGELAVFIVIPQEAPFGTNRQPAGREYPQWEPLYADGVRIDVIAEWYTGIPAHWPTAAHELSHLLFGTGDMYFGFFQPYAAGAYSIMDQARETYMDAYDRTLAGAQSARITKSGCYKINDAASSGEIYAIYGDKNDEFFLVENRQGDGKYEILPDSGLAVWHVMANPDTYGNLPAPEGVDENEWAKVGYYDWARRGIRMIRPAFGPPFDDSKALWDGADATQPKEIQLKWSDGSFSGFRIRNISPSGKEMAFYVEKDEEG